MNNKKIDFVVGARPNFIKAFPVYRALEKLRCFKLRLINTGQHYDENMVDVFFEQLKMKEPDINLEIGSGKHGEQTGKILTEIEKVFIEKKPDLVIVFGDVNSTFAAALAATKLHIPVAHVEAGLRSFDRTMPEEINRVLTDQIAEHLFITSPEAETNLLKEGKKKNQIYFVGNTMIDSLVRFEKFFDSESILKHNKIDKENYVLVTLHRPSNVDNEESLGNLIEALNQISDMYPIIWPIHPRTKNKLAGLKIHLNSNIIIFEPLGYLKFMGLQKYAKFILTDSGGVQEESTYFGVPCFTIRDNTERSITIKEGTNTLVGTDFNNLLDIIQQKIADQKNNANKPMFWDGKSSQRISSILKKVIS